jgi:hypothetical protein
MTDNRSMEERELMRRWVETWKRAGPELEAIREREMREVSTPEAVRQLLGSTTYLHHGPRLLTSGLVEQQAYFALLRKKIAATTAL